MEIETHKKQGWGADRLADFDVSLQNTSIGIGKGIMDFGAYNRVIFHFATDEGDNLLIQPTNEEEGYKASTQKKGGGAFIVRSAYPVLKRFYTGDLERRKGVYEIEEVKHPELLGLEKPVYKITKLVRRKETLPPPIQLKEMVEGILEKKAKEEAEGKNEGSANH